MSDEEYQPISCSAYDIYEIAIMRRQPLQLSWWDGPTRRSARVTPVDLQIRDGAEYLLVRQQAQEAILAIRLDRIVSSALGGV
jgi:transcriptional antiterminator Rof (Rho-off)